MKLQIILVGLCILISSCATTLTKSAQQIAPADEKSVASCKIVGDVQGSSGWGNAAASVGMQNATNETLERAAELGATHIVWVNVTGAYVSTAHGRAYRCN